MHPHENAQRARSYPRRPRVVPLGRTGLILSRLGFGTVWMGPHGDDLSPAVGAELLHQAFPLGVTFWDTSDDYGTHPHVARALQRVPREGVVLASKTTEAEGAVARILADLGTDYLDMLFMHGVDLDWIEAAHQGLRLLQASREAGRVRAVGLSTHSAAVAREAASWPEVEVLMLPLNRTGICLPDYWIEDGGIEAMLPAARQAAAVGKGVIAMKVYGCGTLAGEGREALAFAARLPFVHSLCIGIRSVEDLQQNVAWLEELEGAEAPALEQAGPGQEHPEESDR